MVRVFLSQQCLCPTAMTSADQVLDLWRGWRRWRRWCCSVSAGFCWFLGSQVESSQGVSKPPTHPVRPGDALSLGTRLHHCNAMWRCDEALMLPWRRKPRLENTRKSKGFLGFPMSLLSLLHKDWKLGESLLRGKQLCKIQSLPMGRDHQSVAYCRELWRFIWTRSLLNEQLFTSLKCHPFLKRIRLFAARMKQILIASSEYFLRHGQLIALLSTGYIEAGTRRADGTAMHCWNFPLNRPLSWIRSQSPVPL